MRIPSRKLATGSVIACLALFSAVTSCKKSSGSSSPLTASVGGKTFAGNTTIAIHSSGMALTTINSWQANGKDSAEFSLWIPDTLKLNVQYRSNYNISTGIDAEYMPKISDANTVYSPNTPFGGNISMTILVRDTVGHSIAGTVSGVFYNNPGDSILVTNLRFNTPYKVAP